MEVDNKKLRILITGANGFVGSHVLENLINDGNYKIGITLRTTSDTWRIKSILSDNIDLFYIDKETLETTFSKFRPDLVIHLASFYRKKHSLNDIEEMINSNITFPTKILEIMVRYNIRFFINTGTLFEYLVEDKELNANSPVSPFNLYASSKIAFEDILKFYTKAYDIKAITLKLLAVYGPKDNINKFIPYILNCAIENKIANISPGEQMWDYIYVKDVARAYKLAIEYIINSKESYNSFIIGSGETHSLKEIVEIIKNFNAEFKVNYGAIPYNEPEIYYVKADITKSRNILKWWPKYSLKEGLLETYEYYRKVKKIE
ncbi:MAG: NAD(P)-dependent oxidoreductase [Candidatus Micrarchaeia archaeon]